MKILITLMIGAMTLFITPSINANEIAIAQPAGSSVGQGATDSTKTGSNSTLKQVGFATGLIGVATVVFLLGIHNHHHHM